MSLKRSQPPTWDDDPVVADTLQSNSAWDEDPIESSVEQPAKQSEPSLLDNVKGVAKEVYTRSGLKDVGEAIGRGDRAFTQAGAELTQGNIGKAATKAVEGGAEALNTAVGAVSVPFKMAEEVVGSIPVIGKHIVEGTRGIFHQVANAYGWGEYGVAKALEATGYTPELERRILGITPEEQKQAGQAVSAAGQGVAQFLVAGLAHKGANILKPNVPATLEQMRDAMKKDIGKYNNIPVRPEDRIVPDPLISRAQAEAGLKQEAGQSPVDIRLMADGSRQLPQSTPRFIARPNGVDDVGLPILRSGEVLPASAEIINSLDPPIPKKQVNAGRRNIMGGNEPTVTVPENQPPAYARSLPTETGLATTGAETAKPLSRIIAQMAQEQAAPRGERPVVPETVSPPLTDSQVVEAVANIRKADGTLAYTPEQIVRMTGADRRAIAEGRTPPSKVAQKPVEQPIVEPQKPVEQPIQAEVAQVPPEPPKPVEPQIRIGEKIGYQYPVEYPNGIKEMIPANSPEAALEAAKRMEGDVYNKHFEREVKKAGIGLEFKGTQSGKLVTFDDPITESTLNIPMEKANAEGIKAAVAEHRAKNFPETKALREAGLTDEQIAVITPEEAARVLNQRKEGVVPPAPPQAPVVSDQPLPAPPIEPKSLDGILEVKHGKEKVKAVRKEIDDLWKDFDKASGEGGLMSPGAAPQATQVLVKLVGKYAELGVYKFEEIAADLYANYGEKAKKLVDELKSYYDTAREQAKSKAARVKNGPIGRPSRYADAEQMGYPLLGTLNRASISADWRWNNKTGKAELGERSRSIPDYFLDKSNKPKTRPADGVVHGTLDVDAAERGFPDSDAFLRQFENELRSYERQKNEIERMSNLTPGDQLELDAQLGEMKPDERVQNFIKEAEKQSDENIASKADRLESIEAESQIGEREGRSLEEIDANLAELEDFFGSVKAAEGEKAPPQSSVEAPRSADLPKADVATDLFGNPLPKEAEAPKPKAVQDELFTPEQKGQAQAPKDAIKSDVQSEKQVEGTMFEKPKPPEQKENLFEQPKAEAEIPEAISKKSFESTIPAIKGDDGKLYFGEKSHGDVEMPDGVNAVESGFVVDGKYRSSEELGYKVRGKDYRVAQQPSLAEPADKGKAANPNQVLTVTPESVGKEMHSALQTVLDQTKPFEDNPKLTPEQATKQSIRKLADDIFRQYPNLDEVEANIRENPNVKFTSDNFGIEVDAKLMQQVLDQVKDKPELRGKGYYAEAAKGKPDPESVPPRFKKGDLVISKSGMNGVVQSVVVEDGNRFYVVKDDQGFMKRVAEKNVREGGTFFGGGLLPMQSVTQLVDAMSEGLKDIARSLPFRMGDAKQNAHNIARNILRATAESQFNPKFKKVSDALRTSELKTNAVEYEATQLVHSAFSKLSGTSKRRVADMIYRGNENRKVYTDVELARIFNATPEEILSYRNVREAQAKVLDLKKEEKLYPAREELLNLNDQLAQATDRAKIAGIQKSIVDNAELQRKINNHFEDLKDHGYVSTKRNGKIAVYAEDPTKPVDSKERMLYTHAKTWGEAGNILRDWEAQGYTNGDISRVQNLPYNIATKLTPGEFESVIMEAGYNSHALPADIQKIKDVIYSRYSTKSYEINREMIRGYARTPENLTETILRQGETYSGSYYSSVGRGEAMKALHQAGIDDPGGDALLFKFTSGFVDAETRAPVKPFGAKLAASGREAVYFWQLAGDVGQFFLNAVTQPLQQTYSYFARPEFGLKGVEAEKFFVKAYKLGADGLRGKANPEFQQFMKRAQKENVSTAEFAKALAESETGKVGKMQHYSSFFMRAGEKVTRTHALAEGYLVGKKLGKTGDALYSFMVDGIDATQGRFRRGEAPGIVRATGEVGKAMYQFASYGQMWAENFALALRSDFQAKRISATPRHIAAALIASGITGLPAAGLARYIYIKLTGKDPKNEFDKLMKDHDTVRDVALYGVTGNPGISTRVGTFNQMPLMGEYGYDPLSNIPLYQTLMQAKKGAEDVSKGDYLRGAEGLVPRAIRSPIKAVRYAKEGVKTRETASTEAKTIVPRGELTAGDIVGTALSVQPRKVISYYDKQHVKAITPKRPSSDIQKELDAFLKDRSWEKK